MTNINFLYMTGLAYLASFVTYHVAVSMGAG
jgi:ferrous iron transport protein B